MDQILLSSLSMDDEALKQSTLDHIAFLFNQFLINYFHRIFDINLIVFSRCGYLSPFSVNNFLELFSLMRYLLLLPHESLILQKCSSCFQNRSHFHLVGFAKFFETVSFTFDHMFGLIISIKYEQTSCRTSLAMTRILSLI